MAVLPTPRLDIGYEVIGAGPPMVALHGATTSGRRTFGPILDSMASAFLVHLPDARGHASTRWDVATGGFEATALVDDLEAFVDGLGLATFHLVGYSMGGMTALAFAARRPDRVRTLVVMSVAPDREPRASVVRTLMDPDRIERADPTWAADLAATHDPVQGPGAWRLLLPAIAADVAVQPLLAPADLRRIDAPALVVVGDRDPVVPVAQAAALARGVRDGRLLVVPGCGHEVVTGGTAVVDAALAGFYRSTEPVARRRGEAADAPAAPAATPEPPATSGLPTTSEPPDPEVPR